MTADVPPVPSDILAGIRAIEQAATEGPWEAHSHAAGPSYTIRVFDIWHDEQDAYIAQDCLTEADAQFIVTARTAMPRLLAAFGAVLELADDWDARARQLDAEADAADGQITARSERRTAVTLSARAGVHDKCAHELRAAIRAALTGTGKEGSEDE